MINQKKKGDELKNSLQDAFAEIIKYLLPKAEKIVVLKYDWIITPLGPMIAIADQESLYLLEFIDRYGLKREIEKLRIQIEAIIVPGKTPPIYSIQRELELYFLRKLKSFKTSISLLGSPFQNSVWQELQKIPLGITCSYTDIARAIKKPLALRAVGRANGANQLAIIIPCHRVISADGNLRGYAGGMAKKKWLLLHEMSMKEVSHEIRNNL